MRRDRDLDRAAGIPDRLDGRVRQRQLFDIVARRGRPHDEELGHPDGKPRQGKPFDKGTIYKLLNNRLYIGEVVHKGTSYPGEHEAIIDRRTWDSVQAVLAKGAHRTGSRTRAATPAPLKGLLRCGACGKAMTPSSIRRRGRSYRYYLCTTAVKQGHANCPVRSISASEIEGLVLAHVRRLLRAPEVTARTITAAATDDDQPAAEREREVRDTLRQVEAIWDDLFPAEQHRVLHLLVATVTLAPDGLDVTLRTGGIRSLAAELGTDDAGGEEIAA